MAIGAVPSGSLVTATAVVTTGTTPLTAGQVNFCDAEATQCDSIHIVGSAQVTNAGTAILHFIPGLGSRSYKAVFAGTNTNAASTSAIATLRVTGSQTTTTAVAQNGRVGNFTLTGTLTTEGPVAPTGVLSFS